MRALNRSPFRLAAAACAAVAALAVAAPAADAAAKSPDAQLDAALQKIVARKDGPPGISVVVQRGDTPVLHTAGAADLTTKQPFTLDDSMRLASVAKAFTGAAALALVAQGKLSADATIGATLPGQPAAWADVTLQQLLQHTSGIPDFSQSDAFQQAVGASLDVAPPPEQLLTYVANEPLSFKPGSKYHYSNSDNTIVALMVQAVTGTSYADALGPLVYEPLGLTHTSLPSGTELPSPKAHGYQIDPPAAPEDVTEVLAAGWAWASGGIVSTPADANAFVRGYASGKETDATGTAAQFKFRAGSSEPPGPGTNSAGMGIFRYSTKCGTLYGHTGNTPGYTQFVASTKDGKRSTVVSVNSQLTPERNPKRFAELHDIYLLAACAALEG
jgi:D-alanyl-D-alanine carboxypeptidase